MRSSNARAGRGTRAVTLLCSVVAAVSLTTAATGSAGATAPQGTTVTLPTYAATSFVPVGAYPSGIAVDPVTHQVFVGTTTALSVINGSTDAVTSVAGTGSTYGLNGVAVDPNTGQVWFPGSIGVQEVEANNDALLGDVSTYDGGGEYSGYLPWGVAVDPATRTVWTADSAFESGQVSAIDESTNSLIGKNVAVDPDPGGTGAQPHGIALNLKKRLVYTADLGDTRLSVISMSGSVLKVIDLSPYGGAVEQVAYDATDNEIYLSMEAQAGVNSPDGELLVLNGSTYKEIKAIPLGVDPGGIAFDPAEHAIFVTDQLAESGGENGGLSVIDDQTLEVTQTVQVGGGADGVAVDPVTHTVYVADANTNDVAVVDEQVTSGPGTIGFGASSSSAAAGSTATVTVTRGGFTNLTSTVDYATSNGTGKAGTDYKATTGTLTFPPGATFETFTVPTKAPTGATGVRTVHLALTNVTGGSLTTPTTATLTIDEQVAPVITSAAPPTTASTIAPFHYTFTASGNPRSTFTVGSGSLPPGLTLGATGTLSGKPTVGGTYTFTIAASNGVLPAAATPSITITVSQPPKFTADTPPTSWTVGVYNYYYFATSALPTATYAVGSGTLPPGLVLINYAMGGVPTTAGSWTFTITASNGVGKPATTPPITITVSN